MEDEDKVVVTSDTDIRSKLRNSVFAQLGDQNRFKPNYKEPAQSIEAPTQTEDEDVAHPPEPSVPARKENGPSDTITTSESVDDSLSTESTFDADGNEIEIRYDSNLAEGEERVELVEVDDNGDEDETSPSDLEGGMFYQDPTNPAGTIYKTADDAKRGIRQKDEYIAKLEAKLTETDSLSDTLKMYSSFMPPESLQEMIVSSYMPEELQGIEEDEVTDPNQLKLLRKARIDAELKLERELKEMNSSQVEAEREAATRKLNAQKYLETIESTNFFGVQNPEDRNKLATILNEPIEGIDANASAVALALHEAFGPAVVENYLLGLKSRFWQDVNQKVKKRVKKIITRPRQLAAPERPQPEAPRSTSIKGKLANALGRS